MEGGNGIIIFVHCNGTIIIESLKKTECLYFLNTMYNLPPSPKDIATIATTPSFDLLHKWLTHPGKDIDMLQLMIQKRLVDGLPDISDDAKDFDCTACIEGKMTCSPFQAGHEIATEQLGQLHSYICGPMDIPSLGKNWYFCILVNDKTCYLWFLPCTRKSDFTEWFICLNNLFTNHYHSHMKILQTDQGGEYINESLESYCAEKGIVMEITIPHTPEQNGVAKRSN